MTFPESPRVIFEKNPLEEVICQLGFPTILEIGAKKPANFQSRIRNFYPLYEEDQPSFPKEIADMVAQLPITPLKEGITYKFICQDSKKTVSLNSKFVAFTDTEYRTWDRFYEEIRRAQQALEEEYSPSFYTRIGLRYRDIIDREALNIKDEPWGNLIEPSLLGLLGAKDDIGGHIRNIRTEASIRLDEVPGARATVRHGIGQRKDGKREIYIIDLDFYTTERSGGEHVADIIKRFNTLGGNFFRWAITERLREALEPRNPSPDD